MAERAVSQVRAGERPRSGEQPLPTRPAADDAPAARRPPARPEVAGTLAPPTPAERPPATPRSVRLSAALWWAGCLAGVVGVVTALLDHAALEAKLTASAQESDPAASADVVADGVRATIGLVVGTTGLLVLVSLLWVGLVLRRHGWARWALLVNAALLLLAVDVTQDMVSGGADVDRVAVLVQGALVVLAPVLLLARSARTWFRRTPA